MTELSPAAQSVLDIASKVYVNTDWWPEDMPQLIAAALRAAVATQMTFADTKVGVTSEVVLVDDLLAIANELEAQ